MALAAVFQGSIPVKHEVSMSAVSLLCYIHGDVLAHLGRPAHSAVQSEFKGRQLG